MPFLKIKENRAWFKLSEHFSPYRRATIMQQIVFIVVHHDTVIHSTKLFIIQLG